jgi:hypothetical protein
MTLTHQILGAGMRFFVQPFAWAAVIQEALQQVGE